MKHRANPTGSATRLLRVGEAVRHALADIFLRDLVRDDVLSTHSITVSEVRISPDLRHATVFIEPLGGQDVAIVLEALKRHAGFLKKELGKRLHTKYTPDLQFRRDDSFTRAQDLDALLQSPRVKQDLT